ncbi:MAG: hypothetical protein H8E57_09445 [Candidatus Cloacimonetes bacterium]|nr:hypothetical protein [Candidatus Cloacimonadota bacterium]
MVIKKDFVPTSIAKVVDFLIEFLRAFATYAGVFNFSTEEVDKITNEINKCEADFIDKNEKQNAAKAAITKFNLSKKTAITTVRSYVNRIKPAPPYTEAIGDEMGILGEEIHIDPGTMQPKLKINLKAGVPEAKWMKDYSDGVNIYSKRGNESGFSFLARDTVSPYVDNRPNLEPGKPEDRWYYAYYIFEDQENGIESDTVKITVKG